MDHDAMLLEFRRFRERWVPVLERLEKLLSEGETEADELGGKIDIKVHDALVKCGAADLDGKIDTKVGDAMDRHAHGLGDFIDSRIKHHVGEAMDDLTKPAGAGEIENADEEPKNRQAIEESNNGDGQGRRRGKGKARQTGEGSGEAGDA